MIDDDYIRMMKADMVHQMFTRTADENYITARWCLTNGLYTDFFWDAVHCLEKYMKAALLINGNSSKNFGHNIVELYQNLKILSGNLLPDELRKPADLDIEHWRDQAPEKFLEYLYSNGNADNRYLIYGYVFSSQDLHMLDQMVFATRRLAVYLGASLFGEQLGAPEITIRQKLENDPRYYVRRDLPLDKIIAANEESERRVAGLNLNMEFAPSDYTHTPLPSGFAASNPVIFRRVLQPLASEDRDAALMGIELGTWLLDNIHVPNPRGSDSVTTQIKAAILEAKAKHGL